MKISFDTKTVSLSIGEFSEFTVAPVSSGDVRGGGLWRAQVGTSWHGELRTRSASERPGACFEVPVGGRWIHKDWIVELQGRIDQVLPDGDDVLLREVKTVTFPLPASESDLRETHPAYFRQLAAYQSLYRFSYRDREQFELPRAEIFFLEIGTGLSQAVPLGPEDKDLFENQVASLVEFLQLRESHLRRLRTCRILSPFPEPRPGQEDVSDRLAHAVRKNSILLFHAPTGFGKTGYLLEMALNELKDGRVTRIVYLTGKSTGQIQVLRQLGAMLPEDAPVSCIQVRNKKDHCINSVFHCFRETCPYLDDLEVRWKKSGLCALMFSDQTELTLDRLRDSGKRASVCPYEITRMALAGADIWVGDYNYVFSPSTRSFFHERPGFDPARTFLIIDEAHNLPSRVADNHSVRIGVEEARDVLTEFTFKPVPPGILRSWETFIDLLSGLRPCDRINPSSEAAIRSAARNLGEQFLSTPPDYASMSPETLQRIDHAAGLTHLLDNPDIEKLLWVPREGVLQLTCLDASIPLGETLRSFRSAALASATFGPHDHFIRECGLEDTTDSVARVEAHAPWRSGAYDLAVDLRADTRFRQRARHMPVMAETVARLCRRASGPVAVFFPSYRYARDLLDELESRFSEIRVSLQERRDSLAEQTSFIEESLLLSDALFLILGSSYTESIDLLGGRIEYALVAGPALPEVNAVQKARMESGRDGDEADRNERFRSVYQIPGMRKVNQAIGRLVRAPGHRARILLLCRRFAETSYRELLNPDLRPTTWIATDEDLETWLE